MAEVLAEAGLPVKFSRIGLPDVYSTIGPPDDLYARYGLDAEGIYKKVKEMLGKK